MLLFFLSLDERQIFSQSGDQSRAKYCVYAGLQIGDLHCVTVTSRKEND